MQNANKLVAALLVAVAGLQWWTLSRQADLERQLQNLSNTQHNFARELRNGLSSTEGRIREMAEAQRWVSVSHQGVDRGATCEAAQARVEWDLLQWTPGTQSRLLYRTGPDQAWQEATTEDRGGQNYAAGFTLPGKPRLALGLMVERSRGKNSESVTQGPNKAAIDLDYQYQIVAEGPNLSRSTGPKSLPLHGAFVVPAKLIVREEENGRYRVELFSDHVGQNPCAKVESAEVRTYAGEQLTGTKPLDSEDKHSWGLEWREETPLTRLEVVIRHGGEEEVIDVPLSGG